MNLPSISPGFMRYIFRKHTDIKIFLATILWFAQKGLITIEKKLGNFYITKNDNNESQLSEPEVKCLKTIFDRSKSISISQFSILDFKSSTSSLVNARKTLNNGIIQALQDRFCPFYKKLLFLIPSACFLIIVLYLSVKMIDFKLLMITLVFTYIFHTLLTYACQCYSYFYLYKTSLPGYKIIIATSIFLLIITIIFLLLLFTVNLKTAFYLIILAILFFINIRILTLNRLNQNGMLLFKEISEFKITLLEKFTKGLSVNSSDDLTEFYNFLANTLSYAVALDMEQKWDHDINVSIKKGDISSYNYCPEWYQVPLRGQHFVCSILQEFLPALAAALLSYDLISGRKFKI